MRLEIFGAALLAAAAPALAMGRRPPKEEAKTEAAAAPAAPAERTMTTQEWKGQYGGPLAAGAEVVGDAPGWAALWKRLGKDAPPLDFAKFVAVAAYAGERPTGGFTIEFEEPQAEGDGLVVRARVKKPSGFVTQAFAQPWKVRAVARPKGRVRAELIPE